VSEQPLGGDEIRSCLLELADELGEAGTAHTVVLVGGALLALRGLGDATADVDSITSLNDELQEAIRAVATRHGLAPGWLNASAAPFAPVGLNEADCDVVLKQKRLCVLGAPMKYVFVMKLYAARAPDYDDMVRIWPSAGFGSAEEATALFFDAYPHAPEDGFLTNWVQQIADEAF